VSRYIDVNDYTGDDRRTLDMKAYAPWAGILFTLLAAAVGYGSLANDVETLKDGDYVTKEVLDLKLEPIKQDIEYTKQSVQRVEHSNWEILKLLKAMNDEPLGAHSR